MIKRAHIRQFLAVVEEGSFTAAANRIRVTQPTLSAGIAQLEELLNAKLFVRDRRYVRLTEAGAGFLPIARDLQRGFRAADGFGKEAARDWPTLRLGVIRTIAPGMLARFVSRLVGLFGVEIVEGSDAELRAAFANGRIDAMVGLLSGSEQARGGVPLLTEPYVMFVPAGHRFAHRTGIAPQEFASEIMIARRSCEVLDETSRFFTRQQVRPRFALRSDSDERCLAMVAAGLGVTTAPFSLGIAGVVPAGIAGYDFSRTLCLRFDHGDGRFDAIPDLAREAFA